MKILIENYTFDASAKTVTFTDYSSGGISLASVLLIVNATRNVILYNFVDSTKGGTVSSNILTLTYDTTAQADADKLMIYYDDPDANLNVTLGSGLRYDLDSITNYPVGTTYKNMTASGVILAQPGKLVGCIVSSTSSGVITIYDNASAASGNKLIDSWTIPAGEHNLFFLSGVNGFYFTLVSGSINITFATL